MTAKIIEITPVENYFSITWAITNKCNYECMYCPSELHSGSTQYTFDQMQKYWLDIFDKTKSKNLKYKLSFTGGEVTINKDFVPFLKWLRSNYGEYIHMILVTSNGSASISYYKKLYEVVDNVSFSFHSEHADEREFYEKMIELKQRIDSEKFIHVNIMNEHWIKERIPLYVKVLTDNNISHNVNEINYSIGTRTIPILKGKLNLEI